MRKHKEAEAEKVTEEKEKKRLLIRKQKEANLAINVSKWKKVLFKVGRGKLILNEQFICKTIDYLVVSCPPPHPLALHKIINMCQKDI